MHRSKPSILTAVCFLLAACAASPEASLEPSPASNTPDPTPPASSTPTPSRLAVSQPAAPSATATPEPLAWSSLDAAGPAAREDHTWTIGEGEIAYLFGGRDGATVLGDTWAYDLATDAWTELAPATAPPPRFGHEAVWVDGIGLVTFAGQAGTAFFNDVWAYDPATNAWTQLPASGALPTSRYGSCAGIGPDARLWISHGFTSDGIRFSDTWAYDFASATWADETPAGGARPVERCLHGCWWTDAGELALYAGQTTGITALDDRWTLFDGAWSRVEGIVPPSRNLYARARLDRATLIFGGQGLDSGYVADLWLLADDAVDAVALSPVGDVPPGRAGAEMIWDAGRGRALLFGGRTGDGALDDLWSLRGI